MTAGVFRGTRLVASALVAACGLGVLGAAPASAQTHECAKRELAEKNLPPYIQRLKNLEQQPLSADKKHQVQSALAKATAQLDSARAACPGQVSTVVPLRGRVVSSSGVQYLDEDAPNGQDSRPRAVLPPGKDYRCPTPVTEAVAGELMIPMDNSHFCSVMGIVIAAQHGVHPFALGATAALIGRMLDGNPQLGDSLRRNGFRFLVVKHDAHALTIPGWAGQTGAMGMYNIGRVEAFNRDVNVLCDPSNWLQGRSATVHEVAHAVHYHLPEAVRQKITFAFTEAQQAGRFKDTAAMMNEDEYWAMASEAFFNAGGFVVHSREQLQAYDPALYQLMVSVYGQPAPLASVCP